MRRSCDGRVSLRIEGSRALSDVLGIAPDCNGRIRGSIGTTKCKAFSPAIVSHDATPPDEQSGMWGGIDHERPLNVLARIEAEDEYISGDFPFWAAFKAHAHSEEAPNPLREIW